MNYVRILILLLGVAFLSACDDEQSLTGTYRYTGLYSGSPAIEGLIHLDEVSVNRVRGRWELSRIGSSTIEVGPQIGAGTLEGTFDGGVLSINLNPGVADNNVFLNGMFEGNTIRGTWSFSGFTGVISQGTFIAEHQ